MIRPFLRRALSSRVTFRLCSGTSSNGLSNSSTVELPDWFDTDEATTLQVYCQPEETKRLDATRRFLRALITTADEQEWRDMLSAAMRHGTWRDHHIRAALRAVRQSQYDSPNCTPSTRLRRALGIVQLCLDAGHRVGDDAVHALLVLLLRATEALEGSGPLTTRAVLWRFLAWMELHNYHITSEAILQELEGVVREDRTEVLSVRQNRLDYLRREGEKMRGNAGVGYCRRRAQPRTAPEEKQN